MQRRHRAWEYQSPPTPMVKRPAQGMRKDYDFSHVECGKCAQRFEEGSNVVVLDPDIAAAQP